MTAVILTIHTILVLALVGVVLLQRSEGGALGMGGGGGGGGFMSGRGAANALTRSTTVLAALFFTTSMVLALMADRGTTQDEIVRSITGEEAPAETDAPNGLGEDDILDILGTGSQTEAPAAEIPAVVPTEMPVVETESTEETPVEPETTE